MLVYINKYLYMYMYIFRALFIRRLYYFQGQFRLVPMALQRDLEK